MFDVSHWERAMNGRAIRMLHSVNDGEYGGDCDVGFRETASLLVLYNCRI
jgi:hypothetical protein